MAFTNFDAKEIHCKLLYVGASGAGKSANLRALLLETLEPSPGGDVEIVSSPNAFEFFEFLPVSLGFVANFHLKLHLYAMPARPVFDLVSDLLLKGLDGYVFVADSSLARLEDNLEAQGEFKRQLMDRDCNVAEMPQVLQLNHRDASDALPLEILSAELNTGGAVQCEAIASQREGTLETLKLLAQQVLRRLVPHSL